MRAIQRAGGANQRGSVGLGGTVFRLSPNETRTRWREKVLYSFCGESGCADGASAEGGLVGDAAGNLYGTTVSGGSYNAGTVFELSPDRTGTHWTEAVLHSFCAAAKCSDGGLPSAGLIMDGSGNLYGTTQAGGAKAGGTVFELKPNQTRTAWTETVLHSFCTKAKCSDGQEPHGGVIMDGAGNLYGSTLEGAGGGVFELSPNKAGTAWTEAVLAAGYSSLASLVMDGAGDLYGTTVNNGVCSPYSCGVVFEVSPHPTGWSVAIAHNFICNLRRGCANGTFPYAGLIIDGEGNLYGTTEGGGIDDKGTMFELVKSQLSASRAAAE